MMTPATTATRRTPGQTDADAGQLDIAHALLRSDAFPHAATDLELIETHISWVLLAGPYAYKIKKPVALGFLDFSTRERRRADCDLELRLNRRFAPDVYLGVVDIVRRDGQSFIGGPGEVLEPAVWMRRLPHAGMLTALLDAGQVDTRLAAAIGEKLARMHTLTETGPGVDEYGSPAAIRANWKENFAQTRPFAGVTLSLAQLCGVAVSVERTLVGWADLFRRRVAEGRIRDGHGDLHAGSICIEGERLHFFDCLEFSPRYRCGDVASEVAFLAMDFDYRGRRDLTAAFVDAYVQVSGDRGLLALLDFYRCYRAYVRGKVLSIRFAQEGERDEVARNEARAYFDLASAYAEAGSR